MARFKLREGVTDKDLGAVIRRLAALPEKEKLVVDINAVLAPLVDPAGRVKFVLNFDEEYLRHIVVPWYPKAPSADVDELLGLVTIRGCGD